MGWIEQIEPQKAKDKLKQIYEKVTQGRGRVSNILKIHSLLPETMNTHLELYMSIMFGKSGLSREQKEMIAIIVSKSNNCPYCMQHHGEALNHYWKDPELVKHFFENFNNAPLSYKDRGMLLYAEKLTLSPHKVTEEDISVLKEKGFSDRQILSINLTTSYFNFVNRIALGLGVKFTPAEKKGYKY